MNVSQGTHMDLEVCLLCSTYYLNILLLLHTRPYVVKRYLHMKISGSDQGLLKSVQLSFSQFYKVMIDILVKFLIFHQILLLNYQM